MGRSDVRGRGVLALPPPTSDDAVVVHSAHVAQALLRHLHFVFHVCFGLSHQAAHIGSCFSCMAVRSSSCVRLRFVPRCLRCFALRVLLLLLPLLLASDGSSASSCPASRSTLQPAQQLPAIVEQSQTLHVGPAQQTWYFECTPPPPASVVSACAAALPAAWCERRAFLLLLPRRRCCCCCNVESSPTLARGAVECCVLTTMALVSRTQAGTATRHQSRDWLGRKPSAAGGGGWYSAARSFVTTLNESSESVQKSAKAWNRSKSSRSRAPSRFPTPCT